MRSWLIYNDEPATNTLDMFLNNLDMEILSNEELFFLLASSLIVHRRIFENDEGVQNFYFDSIMKEIKKRNRGKTKRIVSDEAKIIPLVHSTGSFDANKKNYDFYVSEIYYVINNVFQRAYHCIIGEEGRWWEYLNDKNIIDRGFEFILFADSNFTTKMRIISKQSYKYYQTLQNRINRNSLLK